MIFKQNVHLTIGLSELPLVNVGDRQFRELCLSAPRAGYQGHRICGRILEVCNVGGDWLTLAVSITSPGTQIIACIEKRGSVVNAVHAYDPYDLAPGVEGTVSYVYFENADEVITVHGFAYGQRYPGEVDVDDIWGDPVPGEPPVANEFAFLNHRTVKFRDAETDNVWVGEFTGKLLLPEWSLAGTLEGAVPAEVTATTQEVRSVDNVARILKQDIDHIAINNEVTCSEVQAMATGSVQMTGSLGIDSVPNTVPQRADVQAITTAIATNLKGAVDAVGGALSSIAGRVDSVVRALGGANLTLEIVVNWTSNTGPTVYMVTGQASGRQYLNEAELQGAEAIFSTTAFELSSPLSGHASDVIAFKVLVDHVNWGTANGEARITVGQILADIEEDRGTDIHVPLDFGPTSHKRALITFTAIDEAPDLTLDGINFSIVEG